MTNHCIRCGREVGITEIEQLYRAVADREPHREILQLVYDLFGEGYALRPPVAELRLADRCAAGGGLKHG